MNDSRYIAESLINLAGLLIEQQRYDEALNQLSQVKSHYRQLDQNNGITIVLSQKGSIFDSKGEIEQVQALYQVPRKQQFS